MAALVAASLSAAASAGAAPSTTAYADTGDLARSAVAAAKAHPGAPKAGDAQAFTVTDTVVEADGDSHVRMDRSGREDDRRGGAQQNAVASAWSAVSVG